MVESNITMKRFLVSRTTSKLFPISLKWSDWASSSNIICSFRRHIKHGSRQDKFSVKYFICVSDVISICVSPYFGGIGIRTAQQKTVISSPCIIENTIPLVVKVWIKTLSDRTCGCSDTKLWCKVKVTVPTACVIYCFNCTDIFVIHSELAKIYHQFLFYL